MINYENLQVKFKGSNKWIYVRPKTLIGTKVKGKIVKKRTRTWLEIENEM